MVELDMWLNRDLFIEQQTRYDECQWKRINELKCDLAHARSQRSFRNHSLVIDREANIKHSDDSGTTWV